MTCMTAADDASTRLLGATVCRGDDCSRLFHGLRCSIVRLLRDHSTAATTGNCITG